MLLGPSPEHKQHLGRPSALHSVRRRIALNFQYPLVLFLNCVRAIAGNYITIHPTGVPFSLIIRESYHLHSSPWRMPTTISERLMWEEMGGDGRMLLAWALSPMSMWPMRPSLSQEICWGPTLGKHREIRGSSMLGFPMPGEWLIAPLASWLLSGGCIPGCLVSLRRWQRRLWKPHACFTALWGGKTVTLRQCQQSHSLVPRTSDRLEVPMPPERPLLSEEYILATSYQQHRCHGRTKTPENLPPA